MSSFTVPIPLLLSRNFPFSSTACQKLIICFRDVKLRFLSLNISLPGKYSGHLYTTNPPALLQEGYIKILSARINRKSSNSISSEIKSEDSLSMVGNYTPNTIFASMLSFLLMSLATFNVGSLLPVR